jgi:hypothetical protein
VVNYDDTQRTFLIRLGHLADLMQRRKQCGDDDWKSVLLRRAIYSTLCDCIELDVGQDALRLLRRYSTGARH